MTIRELVIEVLKQVIVERERQVPDLLDSMPLSETGLDSLGFAVLVARLEDQLGFDPFLNLNNPIFPRTVGELVETYESPREH